MMKKILKALSLVMVLVMCFTMVFTTAVSAETTTPTLTINSAAVKDGETVTITVDAENFGTIAGAHFVVVLPEELTDVTVAESDFVAYDAEAGTVSFVKEAEWTDGACDGIADGALVTITGKAAVGTYAVSFGETGKTTDFCDANLAEVAVEKVAGSVVVETAVVEPVIDENIVILPAIEVNQQLGMSYTFTTAQLAAYDRCELVVTPTKYSGTVSGGKVVYNEYVAESVVYPDTTWTTSGNYKYVTYAGIGMFELGLNISAYLNCYDAEGNLVAKSNVIEGSSADFLKQTYKNVYNRTETARVNLKVAIAELLVMGGNAQRYFQTRATADCDLAKVTTYVDAADANYYFDPTEFATTEITGVNTVDSTTWEDGAALTSTNTTYMKAVALAGAPAVSYMLKNSSIDASKLTMELSYNTLYPSAETVTETVSGDKWTKSGSWYMFDMTKVRLFDSNKDITAKIYYDGNLILTDVYSVESYVGSNAMLNNTNAELAAVCASVTRFGIAVRNYFVGS